MNANMGIVMSAVDKERVLALVAPRLRTWGGEVVEESGPRRFTASDLDGVEFELFAVTKFIRDRLPVGEQTKELVYAWMTGPTLDQYEEWAKASDDAAERHPFEVALLSLLGRLESWAVMFAPEGDRVGEFISVGPHDFVRMLRGSARDVTSGDGFVAIGGRREVDG